MRHSFPANQLLNITTGHLHTNMDDIYDFFNKVIADGIFTHMLPNARTAILPILKEKLGKFPFEGYHPGASTNPISFEFTDEDKKRFWKAYGELPSGLSRLGTKVNKEAHS